MENCRSANTPPRQPPPAAQAAARRLRSDVVVVREFSRFERRREGSFRAWLRQVTVNPARSHCRRRRRRPADGLDPAVGFLGRLEAPNGELAREWDRDHDHHVFERLLSIVQPEFQPTTWEAFRRFALDGVPAAQVAAELGISENAVLQPRRGSSSGCAPRPAIS